MPDEDEHVTWDRRPVLITESLQILQTLSVMFADSPLQLIQGISSGA